MDAPETLTIGSAALSATVSAKGAELISLRDDTGAEYVWQAGPPWDRHAPILFPVIGRLPGGRLHHRGRSYTHPRHGFARDRTFDLLRRSASEAAFRLVSDAASHALFPFDFALDVAYTMTDATLTITQTVRNTGSSTLGFALGNHPAFFPPGTGDGDLLISFPDGEGDGYVRAPEGFLLPERHRDVPDANGNLVVDDALFARDALIFDTARRRRVRLSSPTSRALTVDTGDFPFLGIWRPVGAAFICIEPWSTLPAPLGWDGEVLDKPGSATLEPARSLTCRYRIGVE